MIECVGVCVYGLPQVVRAVWSCIDLEVEGQRQCCSLGSRVTPALQWPDGNSTVGLEGCREPDLTYSTQHPSYTRIDLSLKQKTCAQTPQHTRISHKHTHTATSDNQHPPLGLFHDLWHIRATGIYTHPYKRNTLSHFSCPACTQTHTYTPQHIYFHRSDISLERWQLMCGRSNQQHLFKLVNQCVGTNTFSGRSQFVLFIRVCRRGQRY